jgi:adenylate cyclase
MTSTNNMTAYDHYLRGRERFRTFTREGVADAKGEFSKAIAIDPGFARAYGWLGYGHLEEIREGWTADLEESSRSAVENASKGVELAPGDYYTHWNLASVYAGLNMTEKAFDEFNQALALNPNDPDLLVDIADKLSYEGKAEQAIEQIERAMALKIPQWYYWSLGFAHFQERQYERALQALKTMTDPPNTAYLLMVACQAKLGNSPSPDAIKERLLGKDRDWKPDHLDKFPFVNAKDNDHYLSALREAGIPLPN